MVLRVASARVIRVSVAHHTAVDVAPDWSSTWRVWASAATVASTPSSRAPSRVSVGRATRSSSSLSDHVATSPSSPSSASIRASTLMIGCPDPEVVLVLAIGSIAAGTTDSRGGQKRQFGGYSQSRLKQYFAPTTEGATSIIWANFDEGVKRHKRW